MAARSVLIRDGVEISVETEEELEARSAMGVTSRGDIVLMIRPHPAFRAEWEWRPFATR